jgi:hypothetical protein
MAKRTTRGARTPAARQPKATSKKVAPAPVAEVEVVEEADSAGVETGIAVMTGLMLLLAIAFTDMLLGQYGMGIFY